MHKEIYAKAKREAGEYRQKLQTLEPGAKIVYLAGAMEGISRERARAWRDDAKELLGEGFITLDPARHPKNRDPKDVVLGDLTDIFAADAILMEFNIPDRIYMGTVMEFVYGSSHLIPIVIWSNLPRIKNDPWISVHGAYEIKDTLESSVESLKRLFKDRKKSVVVSGYASSGKSTLAKRLAEHLDLPFVDGGDALKELAAKEGYKITGKDWWDTPEGMSFLNQRKSDPDFDYKVDSILKGHADQGAVITSWTLPWLHAPSIKIWLDTSKDERVKRLAGRDGIDAVSAKEIIDTRDTENHSHYRNLYSIEFGSDLSPFHCIVDGNKSKDDIFTECIEQMNAQGLI